MPGRKVETGLSLQLAEKFWIVLRLDRNGIIVCDQQLVADDGIERLAHGANRRRGTMLSQCFGHLVR
jgi:hypothetical protein